MTTLAELTDEQWDALCTTIFGVVSGRLDSRRVLTGTRFRSFSSWRSKTAVGDLTGHGAAVRSHQELGFNYGTPPSLNPRSRRQE